LERFSPVVQLELDKTRTLKFDLKAIKDLEAAMGGKTLDDVIRDVLNGGITAIVVALWAGLKHEDQTLSINLTTKILQTYIDEKKNVRKLGRALGEAFMETGLLKSADEEPEGNGQTAQAPSG
jgi:hypothetical protein